MSTKREPWWRTLLRLLWVGVAVYAVTAVVLTWAAIELGGLVTWFGAAAMVFGTVVLARWAWDLWK